MSVGVNEGRSGATAQEQEPSGPFHPDRSTFAHAGRPEMGAGGLQGSVPKSARNAPLLVSQSERVATLPAERILHGLRGTNVTVAYQGLDLVYAWIANPPAGFETISGKRDEDVLAPSAAAVLTPAKLRCIDTGEGMHLTIEIPGETVRWFDVWLEPDFAHDLADEPEGRGQIEGVIIVAIDVTERVAREDRLRVLLREVSHRTRNLLAIVQSIASQTVRAASAPTRFLERFNERLQSLAHTLDLVTLREWEGATLHQLVSRQAGPFRPHDGVFELGGPDPMLTPNAALHLGLAVQELASNALNHGAWSGNRGRVRARTSMDPDGLVFEWSEGDPSGKGAVPQPSGTFGSRTLMSIVPAAVNGEASMIAQPEGFAYRLRVPATNLDG